MFDPGNYVAGQGGLSVENAKPAVIDLYLKLTAAQLTTFANGDPMVFRSPGSVIVYDPNGALYPIAVEVNLADDNPARWITIHAGAPFNVWPFQFQAFGIRVTQLTTNYNSATPVYCGRLIVSRSLDIRLGGAAPEVPFFVREVPLFTSIGTVPALDPASWQVGGTGAFAYTSLHDGTGAGVWKADFKFTNIGTVPLRVSLTSFATLANSVQILPAETYDLTVGLLPSNPMNPTRVASTNTSTPYVYVWSPEQSMNAQYQYTATLHY
jgi:hypothetical protein